MKKLEKDTVINSIGEFFGDTKTPIVKDTQLLNHILDNIQNAHTSLQPLELPNFCQFPKGGRFDDFDFKEGLGKVSIQPAIDALNDFKQKCISEIKTKLQAMGPEGVKDGKLAAGATELILEIVKAASCYVKVARKINNLIDTYISAIDVLVREVQRTIDSNTNQISSLKRNILGLPNTALRLVSTESLQLLNNNSGVFELLAITNGLINEVNEAYKLTHRLKDTPERALLTLETDLLNLKAFLDDLKYALDIKNILGRSRVTAKSMYMSEDQAYYLRDFGYNESTIKAASFNFSITNSTYLLDHNIIDSHNVIKNLNGMCQSYNEDKIMPTIIASESEPGYIVIPDDGNILNIGIDSRLPLSSGMVIELSIDSGATIIRAEAYGKNNDSGVEIKQGVFINKSLDQFSYSKAIRVGTNFQVVVNDVDVLEYIDLGSLYYFKEPSTTAVWNGYSISADGLKIKYIPSLYKVIDISNNSVTLQPLEAQDLDPADFIELKNGVTYTMNTEIFTYTTPALTANEIPHFIGLEGGMTFYISANNRYILQEIATGALISDMHIYGPKVCKADLSDWDKNSEYISYTPGLTSFGTNPATYEVRNDVGTPIYRLASVKIPALNMYRYKFTKGLQYPHAGEKIHCKNWSLYYYLVGKNDNIKKMRFSGEFPTTPITLMAMKAKWGFIPDKK